MDTTVILLLILAVLCAGLIGAQMGRRNAQAELPDAAAELQRELTERDTAKHLADEVIDAARSAAQDAARLAATEAVGASQQSFLTLAQGEMKHLREGLDGQLSVSHSRFELLTQAVDEQLKRVDQQLQNFERQRSESHGEMLGQIRGLHRSQETLRLEAEQLRVALRKPSVRGRWGEMTLRRVVELAGMAQHTDFVEQHTISHDGAGFRPDLVVTMAGGRQVIVDAKCTLDAYLDATEATDELARKAHEMRHSQQMAKHVSALANKNYWASMDQSPDFVVMFVPGDTFLTAALESRPNLIDEAMAQNVVIATPSTLLALLRTIAYGWKQERLADQAAEIWELSRELHGRLATFATHFSRIGKQLDSTVQHYNKAVSSFDRRVMVTARRIEDAQMSSEKSLDPPEHVHIAAGRLEAADEEQERRMAVGGEAPHSETSADEPPARSQPSERLDPFTRKESGGSTGEPEDGLVLPLERLYG